MNKMKILVTYAGIWKSDTGSTGLTLNYFMYGDTCVSRSTRILFGGR